MADETYSTRPLLSLYESYVEALDRNQGPPAALIEELVLRGEQAAAILSLMVTGLSQRDLDELAVRIEGGQASNDPLSRAADAAHLEMLRVQEEVVKEEVRRRGTFVQRVESGDQFAPARSAIIGRLVSLAEYVRAGGKDEIDLVERAEALVLLSCASHEPGARAVAAALRSTTDLRHDPTESHEGFWLRWGLVLDLMTTEHGFGERERLPVHPVTRAEAGRARRLFLAFDRQDPRYDEEDWPLDIPGDHLASLLENAAMARHDWFHSRRPMEDQIGYLTPPRREEPNRPEPHTQIQTELEARSRSLSKGGVTLPMIYPLGRRLRRRYSEDIWKNGIPPLPEAELGWSVFGAPGDIRIQWGAFPHPEGLLVAVTMTPEQILSIGRGDQDIDHEQLLQDLEEKAQDGARSPADYRRRLRTMLIEHGIEAIARYDFLYRETLTPQELIVLNPTEKNLLVIRESVPSFAMPERKLLLPGPRTVTSPR
jgi:hypothetical protein